MFPDGDQPVGIGVGERPQEDAVDDGEDRAGGGDAQRERRDHRRGGGGVAAEHARGVPRVGDEVLERTQAARVAPFFLEPLHAAEIAQGGAPRRLRRLAGAHALGDLAFDVMPHLVVHRTLDGADGRRDDGDDGSRCGARSSIRVIACPPPG